MRAWRACALSFEAWTFGVCAVNGGIFEFLLLVPRGTGSIHAWMLEKSSARVHGGRDVGSALQLKQTCKMRSEESLLTPESNRLAFVPFNGLLSSACCTPWLGLGNLILGHNSHALTCRTRFGSPSPKILSRLRCELCASGTEDPKFY